MLIFCIFVGVLLIFNTFLLIGIAGSMVKLLKYFDANYSNQQNEWERIISERKAIHLKEPNQATYADTEPSNWDGISHKKGWDGIPKLE